MKPSNTTNKKPVVICIYSDEYGFLGVARNYKSAVDFLYRDNWINDDITLYDDNDNIVTLLEYFGNNSMEKMCEWSLDKFNEFWSGCFNLVKCEVYSV